MSNKKIFDSQYLINADIEVNRAMWMMNRPGEVPPKPCDYKYVYECIKKAILDLQLSVGDITKEQHKSGYKSLKQELKTKKTN